MITHKINFDVYENWYAVEYYENGKLIAINNNDIIWTYYGNSIEIDEKITDYHYQIGYEPKAFPEYVKERVFFLAEEIVKEHGEKYVVLENYFETNSFPGFENTYYLRTATDENDMSKHGFRVAKKLKDIGVKFWAYEICEWGNVEMPMYANKIFGK